MRKPSRIPFFTQALTRQPLALEASGSAERMRPSFNAVLNCVNSSKWASLYCVGFSSNSSSIRWRSHPDYGMRTPDGGEQRQRLEHGGDFRFVHCRSGGTSGKRHTGSSKPISAIAAFTGIGFDSTKLISINGELLPLDRAGGGEIALPGERDHPRHLGGNLV